MAMAFAAESLSRGRTPGTFVGFTIFTALGTHNLAYIPLLFAMFMAALRSSGEDIYCGRRFEGQPLEGIWKRESDFGEENFFLCANSSICVFHRSLCFCAVAANHKSARLGWLTEGRITLSADPPVSNVFVYDPVTLTGGSANREPAAVHFNAAH